GACGSCLQIEGACGNGLQTGVCLPDVSSRAHQRPRFEVAVIWCIRKHTVDAYGAGSVNEFTVPQIQRYMRNVRVGGAPFARCEEKQVSRWQVSQCFMGVQRVC